MLDRARANAKIAFLTDTVVDDVLDVSKKEVTALRLRNLKSGESWDFPASAMFLGIGHIPNAKIFEGQLETDADGYLVTQKNVFTQSARACSRAATCRTAGTAKPSPPPAPAAWPRSKWKNIWKKKGIEALREHSCRDGRLARPSRAKLGSRRWPQPGFAASGGAKRVFFQHLPARGNRQRLASRPQHQSRRVLPDLHQIRQGALRIGLGHLAQQPAQSLLHHIVLVIAAIDSKGVRSLQRTAAPALPGSAPRKPRAAANDSATSPRQKLRGNAQDRRPPWAPADNAPARRDRPNWSRGRAMRQTTEIHGRQNSSVCFSSRKTAITFSSSIRPEKRLSATCTTKPIPRSRAIAHRNRTANLPQFGRIPAARLDFFLEKILNVFRVRGRPAILQHTADVVGDVAGRDFGGGHILYCAGAAPVLTVLS